jgi:RNA polymerase sigma-70 factor (ECF subfamily)
MTSDTDFGALLLAAQQGDAEAYRALLEGVQPLLHAYLRRRLRDDEAVADVSQDVLLTMHRVRHTFEAGRTFEPWFYSIARSRFIDHLRRRRLRGDLEVSTENAPENVAGHEALGWENILEVLETLPASQREAFTMLKIEGLTVQEAAERAGVSVAALKVRAHRAYGILRRAILGSDE